MYKENTEVLSLVSSTDYLPWSAEYNVRAHRVDLENPFVDELGKVSSTIEQSLQEQKEVTVVGRTETGLLAAAALVDHPEVAEILTFWTIFNGIASRFQREGSAWMHEHQSVLSPALRRKITTVYTVNGLGKENMLEHARKIVVKKPKAKTWREGLLNLLQQPVEVYFNPNLHKR